MATGRVLEALRDLGFSDLEGRAYLALIQHGPQSGYALAKLLAKANSNTYTSLEALERNGAVVADEGSPRIYRAVAPDALLAAQSRGFERRRERARRELAALSSTPAEEGAFRLQSPEQVLECARGLLARARSSAIVDAFPPAFAELRADFAAVKARGVTLVVKAYEPTDVDATRIVVQPNGADVIATYAGATWLNIAVDGREALVSLLEPDLAGVRQALWVQSRYVAWTFHCGLACEVAFAALVEAGARSPETPLGDALAAAHELLYRDARGYMDADLKGDE